MSDSTLQCGTCGLYRQFRAGEHVLSPGDLDAGDCWHPLMGQAYRSADDRPIFKDCWSETMLVFETKEGHA